MGHWYHLVARRYNKDGFLAVDATDQVTGSAVGSIKTLNVDKLAWIGGLGEGMYYTSVFYTLRRKKMNWYCCFL